MSVRPVGIEIFYWIDKWSDDQAACFESARTAGYEGVEISMAAGPDLDVGRMRAELDRLDLAVFASTGIPLEYDLTSADRQVRQAGVEYLKRCLDVAARLGSPLLGGVTYAPWLYFPEADDLRPFRDRSARALRQAAATAASLGLTLCLEILNRFESFMFNTVAEGLAFLAQIDHPAVRLQLDTYHMSMEEDNVAQAIREAGPALGHFHCAANNRKLPGRGQVDWPAVKEALDAAAYEGWLVVECFPNPQVETGRTVNTWRPLVTDADAEARQAADFLRRHVS